MLKIGVFIPCYKLDDYLEDVKKCFSQWDEILVIQKSFAKNGQVNVRNEGIEKLKSCDYVWTIDADELISPKDQRRLLEKVIKGGYKAAFIKVIDYVDKYHIYQPRPHKPVVLVDPEEIRFYETRCVHYDKPLFSDDFTLHHLGFTFPEEKMKWKKKNYWNTGNKREVYEIMGRKKVLWNTPSFVKDVICRTG